MSVHASDCRDRQVVGVRRRVLNGDGCGAKILKRVADNRLSDEYDKLDS